MSDEQPLDRAIRSLREDVPVRAEWRDALDRELRAVPLPRPLERTGWRVSPWLAAAAALVCMISGAGFDRMIRNRAASSASTTLTPVGASASSIGVRFSVQAPRVRKVSLVGDFNGWNADASPLVLARDGQTWSTMIPLAAGRHAYAFVIDGEVVRDPASLAAPDEDFGVPNSLVLVGAVR